QVTQGYFIDGNRQPVHAAVPKDKLAHAGVVAAPAPVGVIDGAGDGETDASRADGTVAIVAVVDRAIPAADAEFRLRNVLFARQDGVAQAVFNLHQANSLSGPERPVGFRGNSQIVVAVGARGAHVGGVVAQGAGIIRSERAVFEDGLVAGP